jgi:hypothetical protein
VEVVLVLQELEAMEPPIQVVVEVEVVVLELLTVALAVQALSFFATPAQFNISLVAQ